LWQLTGGPTRLKLQPVKLTLKRAACLILLRNGPDAGGEVLMQDATTADMIWGVAELIEYTSRSVTLDAGDVIATGTPSGVGVFRDPPVFLDPGDRVRCEIDGIGSIENPVIDWFEDIDDADVVEPVGDFELDDLIGRS